MVDIHTHILPGMDDGSRSIEESLRLLEMLKAQGVTTVAATPHFYPDREHPERFLKRREQACKALTDAATPGLPNILPGSEVLYFSGISRTQSLPLLQIGQTGLLLLEMPACRWSDSMIREITLIQQTSDLTVVLAHIERYISLQPKRVWDSLLDMGILFQVNADSLLNWRTAGKLLRMLRQENLAFVASDCHGLRHRPPRISEASELVNRKLGAASVMRLQNISSCYFD